MRLLAGMFVALVLVSALATHAQANSDATDFYNQIDALNWTGEAATRGVMPGVGDLTIDKDLKFLASPDSNKFVELNGNPPSKETFYILSKRDYSWFAGISFMKSGYIKDNEKIDADALLEKLKEQNVASNEERKRLNLDTLTLVGWSVPPHYDEKTKRLEWGERLTSGKDSTVTINYTVRILGRSGYVAATLVSDPENFDAQVQDFKATLDNFKFEQGESYAEFRQGDKIAEYGLAALVVGGGAAVLAKSGAGFLKLIFVAIAGAGAAILSWIKNLFGNKKQQ